MGTQKSNKVAGKNRNKCKTKKRAAEEKRFEKDVEELALALVKGKRTSKLVDPYMYAMKDVDQAAAWIKIVALLLMVDGDVREKMLNEVLSDEKEFLMMYVNALDAIIKEEVENIKSEEE